MADSQADQGAASPPAKKRAPPKRGRTRSKHDAERIASVEWSRDGMQAVLYLDGIPQGLYDFRERAGYCRLNFPNFLEEKGDTWRKSTHAWSEAAIQRFEAELYGMAPDPHESNS